MTYEDIKEDVKIETFYPYTDEQVDELQERVSNNFSGIVFPVYVEEGLSDSFRIIKQKNFKQGSFNSSKEFLCDFLRKLDLKDKKIFLSVIDLFNALGSGVNPKEELHNLELLKKAIYEVYNLNYDLIINNNIYNQVVARKEFFQKLALEYPDLDYAYTIYNRLDCIQEHSKIVPQNVIYRDIINYINEGKEIYLPEFENIGRYQYKIEDLLKYYTKEKNPRDTLRFKQANITVISKTPAVKRLTKQI